MKLVQTIVSLVVMISGAGVLPTVAHAERGVEAFGQRGGSGPGISYIDYATARRLTTLLYPAILWRAPDEQGLEVNTQIVVDQGLSGLVQVGVFGTTTAEFYQNVYDVHSAEEILSNLDGVLLNREPNYAVEGAQIQLIQEGRTGDVVAQILYSDEFRFVQRF